MAYPALPINPDSKRVPRDGREERRSADGTTYVTLRQSADKYDFEVHHSDVNSTDFNTLSAFYEANFTGLFDFVWPEDGLTYTGVKFGKGGLRTQWVAPGLRDVYVRLVQ